MRHDLKQIKTRIKMLIHKANTITTILALKGSGKSVLTEFLILQNSKSSIIFDPNETLGAFKNRVFIDGARSYEAFKAVLKVLQKANGAKVDIVIINCFDCEPLLSMIWQRLENMLIVIDEVDLYYSAFIPRDTAFFSFINRGRHKQFDLIANARRPAKIPRDLTSQSDFIYLGFVGREPLDLKFYKEVFCRTDNLPKTKYTWRVFDTNEQTYYNFAIDSSDFKILERGA